MEPASPTQRPTPPEKPASVRILEQNPDFCCAALQNVAAVVWNHPPTLESFERSAQVVRSVVDEHRAGIGVLVVLRNGDCPEESTLVRRAAYQRIRDWGGAVSAIATVVGGSDVFSRINRLPLQLRSHIARGTKERYFGLPSEACAWLGAALAETAGSEPEANQLAHCVDWLLDFYPAPHA